MSDTIENAESKSLKKIVDVHQLYFIFTDEGSSQLLFPPTMRAGAGLMAVIPQQQVHQSQQQQGQPGTLTVAHNSRPNSLPTTPITLGLKRLSEEDSEQNGIEAKRSVSHGKMYTNLYLASSTVIHQIIRNCGCGVWDQ